MHCVLLLVRVHRLNSIVLISHYFRPEVYKMVAGHTFPNFRRLPSLQLAVVFMVLGGNGPFSKYVEHLPAQIQVAIRGK